jgi:hypothetical protein
MIKLIARPLAAAAPWIRNQTSLKIIMGYIRKERPTHSSPPTNIF